MSVPQMPAKIMIVEDETMLNFQTAFWMAFWINVNFLIDLGNDWRIETPTVPNKKSSNDVMVNVSKNTIINILHELQFSYKEPNNKPLLTQKQIV